MKILKITGIAVALVASAAAGCAQTNPPQAMPMNKSMMMADADMMQMKSCMGMSHDMMMKDMKCMSMMKKMNMSDADMTMMAKCHGMSHDMMMKDMKCMDMMKMHPDMMAMPMKK
jgi:hypothetical protein